MLGCLELQIGSVVWPASQLCTTAVHDCHDIDHGFNQNGVVTRYCSNTGEWQDPDFSQCYFKPEAKPFVHLYFTFYTLSKFHILANLQGIIRSVSSQDRTVLYAIFYCHYRVTVYFLPLV